MTSVASKPLARSGPWAYTADALGTEAMTAVAFDTLKFARALQGKAKFTAEQAEGISEAFADATGEQLATKYDLREEILRLGTHPAPEARGDQET